jgi:hypothetical protein
MRFARALDQLIDRAHSNEEASRSRMGDHGTTTCTSTTPSNPTAQSHGTEDTSPRPRRRTATASAASISGHNSRYMAPSAKRNSADPVVTLNQT